MATRFSPKTRRNRLHIKAFRGTRATSQLPAGRPGRRCGVLGGAGSRKFCLVTACRACRGAFKPTGPLTVWSSNFKSIMNTKCITTCCSAALGGPGRMPGRPWRPPRRPVRRWSGDSGGSVPWRPRWAAQIAIRLWREPRSTTPVVANICGVAVVPTGSRWCSRRNRARVAGPATV